MGLRRLLALSFRICIYPLARPDRASGHAAVDSFLVLFTVAVGDGRRAATRVIARKQGDQEPIAIG
jgi:hypothetical protein